MTDRGEARNQGPDLARLERESRIWTAQIRAVARNDIPAVRVRRRRLALVLGVVVAALWASLLLTRWIQGQSDELPAKLLGNWVATDPKYAGRTLGITDGLVAFGTGEGREQVYPIERVRRVRGGESSRYEIDYSDVDGSLSVVVDWDPISATLRLDNLAHVVWVHRVLEKGR